MAEDIKGVNKFLDWKTDVVESKMNEMEKLFSTYKDSIDFIMDRAAIRDYGPILELVDLQLMAEDKGTTSGNAFDLLDMDIYNNLIELIMELLSISNYKESMLSVASPIYVLDFYDEFLDYIGKINCYINTIHDLKETWIVVYSMAYE